MKSAIKLFLLAGLLFAGTAPLAARAQEDDEDVDEADMEEEEEDAAYEDDGVGDGPGGGGGDGGGSGGARGPSVHHLTNMEDASPDALTTYVLPSHTEGEDFRIPVNEEVSIVVGFINTRSADAEGNAMKVKAIAGSLNSAFNNMYFLQNFSVIAFQPQEVVDAGAEMSFEYIFKVDPTVDLQASQLALTIFYEDESEDFTTTFFNETVMLYENNSGFDHTVVGTYFITGGIFLGLLYLAYLKAMKTLKAKGYATKKASAKKQAPTRSTAVADDDYLDDLNGVYASGSKKSKKKGQ